ncbi:hypothetical protein, partial [Streptomyces sp. NPDC001274]
LGDLFAQMVRGLFDQGAGAERTEGGHRGSPVTRAATTDRTTGRTSPRRTAPALLPLRSPAVSADSPGLSVAVVTRRPIITRTYAP